jgi:hypothetical protein
MERSASMAVDWLHRRQTCPINDQEKRHMSKIVKSVATAALLLSGATYVAAQTQNPNADSRPLPQDGTNNQPYDKKAPTTPPADNSGVGSRPIGPPASNSGPIDAKPETPADKNTTDLKKLDKQGRGGQSN